MPPTHGRECGGTGFDTVCPDCRRYVFYFHCAHGSKVFFDQPGGDWPRHACKARTTSRRGGKAWLPKGGIFDYGAFPGIAVHHGGYTFAVIPPIQPRQLKCRYCGIPQSDPKNCASAGKPPREGQSKRLRAKTKLSRSVVQAASEDSKRTAIGTISKPRIRMAKDEPTKRQGMRGRQRPTVDRPR